MTTMTSIQELTGADWALHYAEVQRLKADLFARRTATSLYIVGPPSVIAPSVVVCWYPEPPKRTLLRGGVMCQLHFPGASGLSRFSVQHWLEDRYWIHANYVDERGACYSRFSVTVSFEQLPTRFVECVDTMAREYALQPLSREK
jgi:hypothetical protein